MQYCLFITFATCIEVATGSTIIDETTRVPTTREDMAIVTAVKIVKIPVINPTDMPASLTDSSSKVI